MGCPVPLPCLWAAALSPPSEGRLKGLDLGGGGARAEAVPGRAGVCQRSAGG